MAAPEPDVPASNSAGLAGATELGIPGLSECREIGSGGFARVYYAKQERFDRPVAVKVIDRIDARGKHRFEREQLTMGRMTAHDNVVVAYSSGYTSDGLPYLVMEYLGGGTLADRVEADGPITWDRAVEWLLPVADALGHGHQLGIIHRDVKPENILLTSKGVTKLADFGIASIREASTTTQSIPFSLAHAPPETFRGGMDLRDERSDIYSLASTLFTIVEGRAPFHRDDPTDSQLAYIVRIADEPVPPLRRGPPELGRFLCRALAKNPADRPASAAEFMTELAAASQLAARTPPPVPDPEPRGDVQPDPRVEIRRSPRSEPDPEAPTEPDPRRRSDPRRRPDPGLNQPPTPSTTSWVSVIRSLLVGAAAGAAFTGALGLTFMSPRGDLGLARAIDGVILGLVTAGAVLGFLLPPPARRTSFGSGTSVRQTASLAGAALVATAITALLGNVALPLGTSTGLAATIAAGALALLLAVTAGTSMQLAGSDSQASNPAAVAVAVAVSTVGVAVGAVGPLALEGRLLDNFGPVTRGDWPAAFQWSSLDPFMENIRWAVGLALAATVLVLVTDRAARAEGRAMERPHESDDAAPGPQRIVDPVIAVLSTYSPVAVATSLPGLATPVVVPVRFGLVVASFLIGLIAAPLLSSWLRAWRPSTVTGITQGVGALVVIAYSFAVAPLPTDLRAVLAFFLVCAGSATAGAGLQLAWAGPDGPATGGQRWHRVVAVVPAAVVVALFWHFIAANNFGGLAANNVAGVALIVGVTSLVTVAAGWTLSRIAGR